jgi:hypothetical protein
MDIQPDNNLQATLQEEALPEFPKLPGPLGQLADAISNDIPYEHKALALLTYIGVELSGRTQLTGDYDHLQPRFYACLISPTSGGKSWAVGEVQRALKDGCKVHVEGSINSERQLVETLEEHHRLLYAPDEAILAFDKFKQPGIRAQILSLFEGNYAKYRLRLGKYIEVHDAHFAFITTCQPQVFSHMWTGLGGASSGLQSRFILSYSEQSMPMVRTRSDTFAVQLAADQLRALLKRVPEVIDLPGTKGDFTKGLVDGLNTEELGRDELKRVLDMAKRFSLVMAVCNGKERIDEEIIQLGNSFVRYQLAALDRFMPPDSWTWEQRFENSIIRYFETRPGEHAMRNVQNWVTPARAPGGLRAFKSAWDTVVATKELIPTGKTNRSGFPLLKLNPERAPRPTVPTVWIREPSSPVTSTVPTNGDIVPPVKSNQDPDPTVHTVDVKDSGPTVEYRKDPTPTVPTVEVREPDPKNQPSVDDQNGKASTVQFRAFTARCTNLVRHVLPGAGKDAPALLLPYLKRTFGVEELQDATTEQWERTLAELENAGGPEAVLAILNKPLDQQVQEEKDPSPTVPTPLTAAILPTVQNHAPTPTYIYVEFAIHPIAEWLSMEQINKLIAEIFAGAKQHRSDNQYGSTRNTSYSTYGMVRCRFSNSGDAAAFKSWVPFRSFLFYARHLKPTINEV